MAPDKIIEIASRYDSWVSFFDSKEYYGFTPEDLIAFAQAILEAKQERTTIRVPMSAFVNLVKDVNTVKDLLIAMKSSEKKNEY